MTETAGTAPVGTTAEPETELPKMSFLEHLEELRKRIFVSIIAIFAGFLICWYYAERIFELIEQPLTKFLPPGQKLVFTRLTEPFMLYMKVAFFAGIFVASPIILMQVWLFIAPGLYKRERRYAAPFIIIATLFFLAGGYFGYRWFLPGMCEFFLKTGSHFQQMIKIDEFFSFASTLILSTGLVFETPILIFFLARLGIVTPAFLMQKFRYAVVVAVVIAAFITPSPDIMNQSVMAAIIIALYLIGVGVAYLFQKKPAAS